VNRDSTADAPNLLWLADITYVRTWSGFCYVAFVEDAFSRMIVGWSIATHLPTSLATEALEMAVWRRNATVEGLVHHSDAGIQLEYIDLFTSAGCTERSATAHRRSSRRCSTLRRQRTRSKPEGLYRTQGGSINLGAFRLPPALSPGLPFGQERRRR
jgi:transposase InsO family protein